MKQILAIAALCALPLGVLPVAALAEDPPKQAPPMIEGLDELADGMRKLLEGFTNDVAPLMEDLADDMAPLMQDLSKQLQGLNAYHPPEVLPNGDIIIRRKTPKDLAPKADEGGEDAIDI